jgi:hypothetical protein
MIRELKEEIDLIDYEYLGPVTEFKHRLIIGMAGPRCS